MIIISSYTSFTFVFIVDTIGTIDDLIEKNKEITSRLEQYGKLLVANLNDGCKQLNQLLEITTGKLNANEGDEKGIYPFFTCSENNLFINKYSFDGESILVSGNGSRLGYVNYYNGKFNAYQRTYVLSGKRMFYICYFEIISRISEIASQATGSAVPYLTKPMFDSFKIYLYKNNADNESLNKKLQIILYQINNINQRNEKLKILKTKLLQKYF